MATFKFRVMVAVTDTTDGEMGLAETSYTSEVPEGAVSPIDMASTLIQDMIMAVATYLEDEPAEKEEKGA